MGPSVCKYVYPVIFERESDGGFCVYAPDLPGCVTEAADYADGIEKIRDGISGVLYIMDRDHIAFPAASDPAVMECESGDVVALIDVSLMEYKRKVGSKAVRRTISIPEYLDEMAAQSGVSLSQVTQDALRSIFSDPI
jgi:predicted RNase H-like HicB family nuclease